MVNSQTAKYMLTIPILEFYRLHFNFTMKAKELALLFVGKINNFIINQVEKV
jgi:hypothetical protein